MMTKSYPLGRLKVCGLPFVVYAFYDTHPLFVGYAVSYVSGRLLFVSLPHDDHFAINLTLSRSSRIQRLYDLFVPSEDCFGHTYLSVHPFFSDADDFNPWVFDAVRGSLLRGDCSAR